VVTVLHPHALSLRQRLISIAGALTVLQSLSSPVLGETKAVVNTTTKAHSPAKAVPHAPKKMMVPPPPPDIPLMTGSSDEHLLSTLGVPLDYLHKNDLLKMQTRLQASETKLQKEVNDRHQTLKEKRERATQFEDLYKEGVVSKHELEVARRELSEMEESGPDLDSRLKDVQSDLARVNKQLEAAQKKADKAAATKTANKEKNLSKAGKKAK
jgi:hypothetical protein